MYDKKIILEQLIKELEEIDILTLKAFLQTAKGLNELRRERERNKTGNN